MAAGAVTEKARVFKTEHAFEWAFGTGVAVIFLAKLIAQGHPILGGIVASALGIAIMFWYRNDQRQVRPEREQPRLGDEVYYLGLLYTLTSLCAALVSLFLLSGGEQTLEERTDEMIGSFGIALLTTMAGSVMRMSLQRQGTEGQATIIRIPQSADDGVTVDLERYAYELRRQLQNSTNAFAAHANQAILQAKTIHAHMDEMMQAFHDGLEKKAKAELESLKAIYKSVAEKAEEARQRTEAQQEGIQSALERLEAQVKRMDDSIERIRVGSGETAENLGAIAAQAKASTQAFAESGKTVTEGLNAWAEATDAEKTHHAVREQLAVEMGEMLNRQAEALQQMEQTNQVLARLGQEAQRTNTELTILPDGVRKAREAIEHLAEITSASNAVSGLEANAKVVTEQLAGIAGAGRRHEEALDVTVKKLQALAEVSGLEFEGRAKLKEAIAEIAEVATTAGRYKEDLKDTEQEVQRINMGLKGVQNALQDEGFRLAEVLKQAIVAFDEAKHEDNSTRNVLKRMFRT